MNTTCCFAMINHFSCTLYMQDLGIKLSGTLGMVDSGLNPTGEMKQILIEMVAAKSGLWKLNVQTEDGKIETIRTNISDESKKMLNKYILKDIV